MIFSFKVGIALVCASLYQIINLNATQNIGKAYYSMINLGYEYYYVHNNFKKADSCFDIALTLRAPDYETCNNLANIYFSIGDYNKYTHYLGLKTILNGRVLFSKDSEGYRKNIQHPEFKQFLDIQDRLLSTRDSVISKNFEQLINKIHIRSQFVRSIEFESFFTDKNQYRAIMRKSDSIDYFEFVEYTQQYDDIDVTKMSFDTYSKFELFYMHITDIIDEEWGKGYMKKYFDKLYVRGKLTNRFIPLHIERDAINYGTQLFGFYTKQENNKSNYEPIKDVKSVDSLRQEYDLPKLEIDAILNKITLPEGYQKRR